MQTVEQTSGLIEKLFPPSHKRRTLIVVAVGFGLVTTGTFYGLSRFGVTQQRPEQNVAVKSPAIKAVTALGRLEPQGEVIQLAASSQGSRVEQLLVKQGDRVQVGQIIAILDSRDRLQSALEKAQKQVQVAQTRLAQVQAGAKTGEISAQAATVQRTEADLRGNVAAQEATVARLQAELRNAATEFQRYQSLYQEGAISASNLDGRRLTVDTVRAQVREAQANLNRIQESVRAQVKEARATLDRVAEVRPTDVQAAQADVESAIVAVKQAQADLDLAYIRAPRPGQILKIYTYPGETVSSSGIVELGQTDQMYVRAEVYESDVKAIRLGQAAVITSTAFDGEAYGTVDEIGLQIRKKGILDTNPTAEADARVVEVKIRLDATSSRKVAGLTNLEVTTAIAKTETSLP